MKKIFVISSVSIIVLFTSCQNISNGNEKTINNSSIDTVVAFPDLAEAKILAKKIVDNVEQVELKKMTKKEMNKINMPLQKRLDSLRNTMLDYEKGELDNYRIKIINELVDRKVAREGKK